MLAVTLVFISRLVWVKPPYPDGGHAGCVCNNEELVVTLEVKFVPSLFRITKTPLNSAPLTSKIKFVVAVIRLTKVPPLS